MVISEKAKPHLTGILIGLVLGSLFLFIFMNLNEEKPVVKNEPVEEVDSVYVHGDDVYVTDNINDESSAVITETATTVSYWYVYYSAHISESDARYTGYEVIEIPYPYFNLHEAIKKIVPTYKDEDFVGIEYFKRVPFETYKAFKENEK